MRRRNVWPQAIVVAGFIGLTTLFLVGPWGGTHDLEDPLGDEEYPSRTYRGRIVGAGAPVAGARLELREGITPVAEAVAGEDGAYEIEWRPRTTIDPRELRLLARHDSFAPTIGAPARTFEMGDAITVEGVVLTPAGEPWPGVRVEVASFGWPYGSAVSAADGTFSLDGVARGAELEVFVEGGGVAPAVHRGFVGGDRLVVHAVRGKPVVVRVVDPGGNPVEGSEVRYAAADGFRSRPHEGRSVSVVATAGSSAYIVASAPGHVPVYLDAPVEATVSAVLWPAREVELRVSEAGRKRGVFGVELEMSLDGGGANRDWNGPDARLSHRPLRVRMGDRRGEYFVQLPRAPVRLRLSADGYGDRTVALPATTTVKSVRMPALREAASATLRVECDRRIWLVVADEADPWFAAFEAPGEVRVPAGRKLELASAGAADGVWLPPVPVEPIAKGRIRRMRAPLRPAARLIVLTEPPTPCEFELVDPQFGQAVPPARVRANGRASFWVRPSRPASVAVRPEGNFRPIDAEFTVEPPTREWTVALPEAAGLRMRILDAAGFPVPFAEVRVREAGTGGRIELREPPRVETADAEGVLHLLGLRRGPTPLEITAPEFRTVRPRVPELEEGRVLDLGDVVLPPAAVLAGRAIDRNGAPLPGVFVRTLARDMARLEFPGGGARDVYDLTDEQESDAVSAADGTFFVRDRTPRAPMLVAEARGRNDLATYVAPVEDGLVVRLPRAAHVTLPVKGHVNGVYMLVGRTAAVCVYRPGPLRLNPIPLKLPAGRVELYVDYRYKEPAAGAFDLRPGEQTIEIR